MADQVVTVAQVHRRIDVDVADVADDVLIGELIDELTDWLQEITGRKLVPENAATYVVDTAPGSVIQVRRGIRTVTSLGIALTDQPDTGGAYTAIAAADILLRPSAMERKPGWPATRILIAGVSTGRLAAAINGAQVVGDFGFAAVPPAIQAVALDAISTAYTSHRAGASDVIGADGTAVYPWARYFSKGSPQLATVHRYRAGAGMGIG